MNNWCLEIVYFQSFTQSDRGQGTISNVDLTGIGDRGGTATRGQDGGSEERGEILVGRLIDEENNIDYNQSTFYIYGYFEKLDKKLIGIGFFRALLLLYNTFPRHTLV